ncbi:ABC transporter permease [Opitutus sp. ER46]|uniref:ABC transporter permease n=1 Tax=Opitutus sp. ER46 TaxID=2161864 RepID=UPI000D3207FE|nr:ABC transporter permease [Opitutus sp. ER46]PTY00486.1 ABC transporter permease [Opitutus sp. ER46]
MPWYFYLALKQLFPSGRKFPFFTAISVLGVALGVIVLVVVQSVMSGFGYEIRRMIVQTEGEIQIKARTYVSDHRVVEKRIEAVRGVAGATPWAGGMLIVDHQGRYSAPLMRGIDLQTVSKVVALDRYIIAGSFDALDDDSVILSAGLAQTLGAWVGSTIELYSPLILQRYTSGEDILLPKSVRVAGILQIGHQQLDSSMVYCTLRTAQELYDLGNAVHGINVRLKPGFHEDEVVMAINGVLPGDVRAFSWMDSFDEFLWVLNLEKGMMFFLLLIIIIVAAFSVMSSLLISVVRKTREIGLLGALGGKPRHVAACFCAQGFFIGACGTIVGLIGGFTLLAFRNELVHGIATLLERQAALERFYQFSNLPAHTTPGDVITIVIFTVVISTVAGLLPAWRASRLKPVDALRSE